MCVYTELCTITAFLASTWFSSCSYIRVTHSSVWLFGILGPFRFLVAASTTTTITTITTAATTTTIQ